MGMDINSITISGRIVEKPELRYTPKGTAVCDLRLATSRWDGTKEVPVFTDVTVWAKAAEAVCSMKNKGDQIVVTGELVQETWEKDGQKRSKHKIVANRVVFGRNKGGAVDAGTTATADGGGEPAPTGDEEIPF